MLLLLLLLPPPFSPSCCLCCGCRRCLAFLVLLLWLLPLMCSPPHVSFERKIVFRNTSSYFTCALFSSKRHCIENRKVLLRCSACCIEREVRGRPEQAACRAGIRRREEERARASSMQSRSDARSGVALRRRGPALVHGARQRAAVARHRPPLPAVFGRPPFAPASLLGAARFPAFRGPCQRDSAYV